MMMAGENTLLWLLRESDKR